MAMAGTCLNISPSSTSWITNNNNSAKIGVTISVKRCVLSSVSSPLLRYSKNRAGVLTALAVVEEEQVVGLVAEEEEEEQVGEDGYEEQYEYERPHNDDVSGEGLEMEKQNRRPKPCELYVCNLPRSSDIPDLMEMFKPHGTVFSVEISRSPETGLSRGCGYVTMGSIESAKAAISALDGIVSLKP